MKNRSTTSSRVVSSSAPDSGNSSGGVIVVNIESTPAGSKNGTIRAPSSANGGGVPTTSSPSKNDNKSSESSSSSNSSSLSSFKLLLLVMMVLQNSSTVLVGRYSRSSGTSEADLYVVNHLLVIIETGKLLLSLMLEFWTTKGKLYQSIQQHVLSNPLDACKIMVPALLYLVQNSLLYVALGNLTAPIFQVTYQAKLVTTALVSVSMLQRSYTIQQWMCLLGLSLGVATVVLGEKASAASDNDSKKDSSSGGGGNLAVGLVAVTISCFSSALAGVYFEKVLKRTAAPKNADGTIAAPPSLWMRNVQLAFFSVLIALGQGSYKNFQEHGTLFYNSSSTTVDSKPYFHGFTFWVWVLVGLQAGGGLLVAAVIKYADNVLKGLATGVSVVVSSALSMLLFATPLGSSFFLGASMILTSVWFFSNPAPPSAKRFCARTLHIPLNAVWGYKQASPPSSSDDSIITKSLLPK